MCISDLAIVLLISSGMFGICFILSNLIISALSDGGNNHESDNKN